MLPCADPTRSRSSHAVSLVLLALIACAGCSRDSIERSPLAARGGALSGVARAAGEASREASRRSGARVSLRHRESADGTLQPGAVAAAQGEGDTASGRCEPARRWRRPRSAPATQTTAIEAATRVLEATARPSRHAEASRRGEPALEPLRGGAARRRTPRGARPRRRRCAGDAAAMPDRPRPARRCGEAVRGSRDAIERAGASRGDRRALLRRARDLREGEGRSRSLPRSASRSA